MIFQEFFTDTLMSRFIKRLIRSTSLPLLHIVEDGAQLVAGAKYIYNDFIIKCLEPGVLNSKDIALDKATFDIIDNYSPDNHLIHHNYHSKHMFYDPETHYYLGEYLRYLKYKKGINLMPYYNCYSGLSIDDITLVNPTGDNNLSYIMQGTSGKKLLAIPVKFGKTYTIAFDSDKPIQFRTLIYNQTSGNIHKNIFNTTYYSNDIDDYQEFSESEFTKPFLITIGGAYTADLYAQEKNLYLCLQTDVSNNSSLVVLEGDYTNSWKNAIISYEAPKNVLDEARFKNISLMQFNSKKLFAFSSRLFEYLLESVICSDDSIAENFIYLRKLISNESGLAADQKDKKFDAIWDDQLGEDLENILRNLDNVVIRDQDSNLNSDVEAILLKQRKNHNEY